MAFCNACGTNLVTDAKFCPKCGATIPSTASRPAPRPAASTAAAVAAAVPPAASGTPPSQKSGQTLRIVIIVVAVLVGLGILGTVGIVYMGLNFARRTKVEEHDGKVKVQTPFGTVESNQDAEKAMHDAGLQPYPDAEVMDNGAQNVNIGGVHTVSVQMQTDDPPDKVAQFYQRQLPHANVNVNDNKQYTIVSTFSHNLITVNIEPQDGKTMIHIASVSGKGVTDGHVQSDGKAEE